MYMISFRKFLECFFNNSLCFLHRYDNFGGGGGGGRPIITYRDLDAPRDGDDF